jgi:hypothetical protein
VQPRPTDHAVTAKVQTGEDQAGCVVLLVLSAGDAGGLGSGAEHSGGRAEAAHR